MKFFLARKSQLNLERFIKESELLYNDSDIIKKINKKKIEEENKNKQAYPPQESKYNFLQIVKNYNLNRIGRQNGFTKQYISLLTDLLYKNDHENYSSKRLSFICRKEWEKMMKILILKILWKMCLILFIKENIRRNYFLGRKNLKIIYI